MLKKGDRIRESGYGYFIDSTIISDVKKSDFGKLEFRSVTDQGYEIDYLKCESSLLKLNQD